MLRLRSPGEVRNSLLVVVVGPADAQRAEDGNWEEQHSEDPPQKSECFHVFLTLFCIEGCQEGVPMQGCP